MADKVFKPVPLLLPYAVIYMKAEAIYLDQNKYCVPVLWIHRVSDFNLIFHRAEIDGNLVSVVHTYIKSL